MDALDWTRPGLTRYVGQLVIVGAGGGGPDIGTLNFTINSYERAAVVLQPQLDPLLGAADVTIRDTAATLTTAYRRNGAAPTMVPGYVNPAFSSAWSVDVGVYGLALGATATFEVFAEETMPLVVVQTGSEMLAVDVRQIWGLPLSVSLDAQAADVAVAARKREWDDYRSMIAGVFAVATVTFPATAGKRWEINYVYASAFTTAAGVFGQSITAAWGATTVFVGELRSAAPNQVVSVTMSDAGILAPVNTAVTVAFNGPGIANSYERIAAGAWLV